MLPDGAVSTVGGGFTQFIICELTTFTPLKSIINTIEKNPIIQIFLKFGVVSKLKFAIKSAPKLCQTYFT